MQSVTYINEIGNQVVFSSNPLDALFLESMTDPLSKTEQSYTAIGQDGQRTISSNYNARTITCNCIYACQTDITTYKKEWRNIINILAPHLKGTLIYANETGSYKINVRPLETPILSKQQFSVQFVADNPYWQSVETAEYVFGTVKPLWRFPFTFANGPLRMGEWQKVFEYNNISGVKTPFKLVIKGVGDYCQITNDNGEFIKVNKPITTGQSLIIDTSIGLVISRDENGNESYANQYVTLDSELAMKLHNGINKLTYDNGLTSLPIATISISQYYVGV
jgi:phage-related protein